MSPNVHYVYCSCYVYVYTIIPCLCLLARATYFPCLFVRVQTSIHLTVTCVYNRSSDLASKYRLLSSHCNVIPTQTLQSQVRCFVLCNCQLPKRINNNYPRLRPRPSRSPKLTNKLGTLAPEPFRASQTYHFHPVQSAYSVVSTHVSCLTIKASHSHYIK